VQDRLLRGPLPCRSTRRPPARLLQRRPPAPPGTNLVEAADQSGPAPGRGDGVARQRRGGCSGSAADRPAAPGHRRPSRSPSRGAQHQRGPAGRHSTATSSRRARTGGDQARWSERALAGRAGHRVAVPLRQHARFGEVGSGVVATLGPEMGRRRRSASSGVSSSNTSTASTCSSASSTCARSSCGTSGRPGPFRRATDRSEFRHTISSPPNRAPPAGSRCVRRAAGRSSRRSPRRCRRRADARCQPLGVSRRLRHLGRIAGSGQGCGATGGHERRGSQHSLLHRLGDQRTRTERDGRRRGEPVPGTARIDARDGGGGHDDRRAGPGAHQGAAASHGHGDGSGRPTRCQRRGSTTRGVQGRRPVVMPGGGDRLRGVGRDQPCTRAPGRRRGDGDPTRRAPSAAARRAVGAARERRSHRGRSRRPRPRGHLPAPCATALGGSPTSPPPPLSTRSRDWPAARMRCLTVVLPVCGIARTCTPGCSAAHQPLGVRVVTQRGDQHHVVPVGSEQLCAEARAARSQVLRRVIEHGHGSVRSQPSDPCRPGRCRAGRLRGRPPVRCAPGVIGCSPPR
jgi:hypothetical protein